MKKQKSIAIITSIALAMLLLVAGISLFSTKGGNGELLDTACRRDGMPDPNMVYIQPDLTALAGELSGSVETQAAAKAALDLINAQRAAAGLNAMSWSSGLEQAAAVRAIEASQKWAHERPDGSDYYTVNPAIVYGENLAKGYSSAQEAFNAWMASPAHKDNIMYGPFKTSGIAIHNIGGQWYWAHEFGY